MTTPLDRDKLAAEVTRLHADGNGRNEIARQLGISNGYVTKLARQAGLAFDRESTKAALEARSIDLAAERIRLAEKMLDATNNMLDSINDPYTVYSFGGKDNTYSEHELDSMPIDARQRVIVAAGITFDKLTRIVERNPDGAEEAVGILDTLAHGFKAAAERIRGDDPDEIIIDVQ